MTVKTKWTGSFILSPILMAKYVTNTVPEARDTKMNKNKRSLLHMMGFMV